MLTSLQDETGYMLTSLQDETGHMLTSLQDEVGRGGNRVQNVYLDKFHRTLIDRVRVEVTCDLGTRV